MPEFVLHIGDSEESHERWKRLDAFTQGYIEALFFTEEERFTTFDGEHPEDPLLVAVSFEALAKEAVDRIVSDCAKFQKGFADDLTEALDNGRIDGYDSQRAGNDFWYTRNGHGVGFWDRNLGDVGETLTKAAQAYGEVYSYVGSDGKVYL